MRNHTIADLESFKERHLNDHSYLDHINERINQLNLEKLPLETIEPSLTLYKKQARLLQSALEANKDKLIAQEKISLNTSYQLLSHVYGFDNWQTLSGIVEKFTKKEFNLNLVTYLEKKFRIFLDEYQENKDFFDEEFLGNREEFIVDLSKIMKKINKLNRVLSDDRMIDEHIVYLIVKLVRKFCSFYVSIYSYKLKSFVEKLWDSKDVDEISKFDPISFAIEDLDKLQIIFERMRAKYAIIYLIHSTRILERNFQSFQQVTKIINILVYCLENLPEENYLAFSDKKNLLEKLKVNSVPINITEIAERYYLI